MSHVRRNYGQYCGLASALDVVGERWTLLIIRELLLGPRRYGELLAELPGIGTNLLAERLKSLVEMGVLTKPASRDQGYELTEIGRRLRDPVLMLARWGMSFLGAPDDGQEVRPHWGFLAVQAMIDPDRTPDVDEVYEFHVDEVVFHISVDQGVPRAVEGPATGPCSMVARTDAKTFVEIGAKRLSPFEALASGRLTLSGDPDAIMRSSALLGLIPAAGEAPLSAAGAY
ncbi:winged helix-turn-helix transcriptional regulator [Planomonospora parontospora]|uniref:winged helix-turn-helix transcriptional regulator n=1 Tax=Planomonospora parontospora TaxID=58119 RepID=UPI0016712F63|nr:winged helix-turn-helix transcriptional regulator [Planomonospora parontospora]GGL40657.1 transcriptional regulator [Planomonospora parontospora subsp. antibiotica]GII18237.1 transcriptional regulator [Planomonospora parontospora subsp. antibiotica]